MKLFDDEESKLSARISLLISLCLLIVFLIFALIFFPGLWATLMSPMTLYENGLSHYQCGVISWLTTLGLMVYFSFVAGERLLDFGLETKLILAGVPVFFFWFWIVLAWLF